MTLNETDERRVSEPAAAALPGELSVDEIVAELELFPDSRRLPVYKNSLGSPYVAFEAPPEVITALAGQDIINAFRRVVLDPVRGLVMLMTPSARHEDLSVELDEVVQAVAVQLATKKRNLRSTRWKPQGGGRNTGDEADNCYYLGRKVVAYDDACDRGTDEQFTARTPPDLVVEVTVSHFDEKKIAAYRALGVSEYWQVKGGARAREADEVTFLELQRQPGPGPLRASRVLDGFTPAALRDCLKRRSSRYDDPGDYGAAIGGVLTEHGILPADDNESGGPPPVPSPQA